MQDSFCSEQMIAPHVIQIQLISLDMVMHTFDQRSLLTPSFITFILKDQSYLSKLRFGVVVAQI